MRRTIQALLAALVAMGVPGASLAAQDHAAYLKGPFASGPEVTKACLKCHAKHAQDFMQTVHWTWEVSQKGAGRQPVAIGKKSALNNFCISISANWPRCTSCHAGYGWKDASFDFKNPENVDCLVCHDSSGSYRKDPKGAGHPVASVDLLKAARSVAKPSRGNCGACHFFGGGGDHVKHGDLDSSLTRADRAYDVHMGTNGADLACQACHETRNHAIAGQAMSVSLGQGPRAECATCHASQPHQDARLNKHTSAVACQTCHIPRFAKEEATKVWWDWSKAGDKQRQPKEDENYMEDYAAIKGEFRWAKNVVPTYAWYNGASDRYLKGDRFDPKHLLYLTRPKGSIADPKAKIYPFKVMAGKQPYDLQNRYLVTPQTYGGFWTHMDWQKAITDGMKATGLPYSGRYGFAETRMYWRINHMVVPKEQALACADCHGDQGRLNWKELGYRGDPQKVGGRK